MGTCSSPLGYPISKYPGVSPGYKTSVLSVLGFLTLISSLLFSDLDWGALVVEKQFLDILNSDFLLNILDIKVLRKDEEKREKELIPE